MNALRVLLVVLCSAVILEAQAPVIAGRDAAKPKAQPKALMAFAVGAPDVPAPRTSILLVREFGSAKSQSAAANARFTPVLPGPSLNSAIAAATADAPLPALDSISNLQVVPARPKAITYTHGYEVRARIHRYASYATLPIFIAEAVVGQKLFDETTRSGSLRSAHSALAAGTAALFGINSVTGVWNLLETRKNPNGRGKRMFHGILMLGADAGFVATGALAPHREDRLGVNQQDASTHRAVALTSMGVATVSYLYMLIAR